MNAPSVDVGVDDLGRSFPASSQPARVVSLVPSITELICELGAGATLVGVTRFCTHPTERVVVVEKIGGTKDPDCDRIVALQPDLVFADRDENRREDFDRLASSGVQVFVAAPRTVSEAALSVRRIGQVLGRAAPAAAISSAISDASETLRAERRRPVRVLCPIWRNPWMCFNRTTFAADLIARSGGESVCASEQSYPRVELDQIARLDPEVILLPDEPYVFRPSHVESLRVLRGSSAWASGRIHIVDGKGLFWYGSRTAAALRLMGAIFAAAR